MQDERFPQNLSLILEEAAGVKLACVFDLDSTLFDVTPRTDYIFSQFKEVIRSHQDYKVYFDQINNHFIDPMDWGISDVLERSKIVDLNFLKFAKHFWSLRFFSDDYLVYDKPYDGSLEFLDAIKNTNTQIYYLTARDQIRMGKGTLANLIKWGFPLQSSTKNLILKPHSKMNDVEFKVSKLKDMQSNFTKIYFFENEPNIMHAVSNSLSNVELVYMDSVHSKKKEPAAHWPFLKKSFFRF